MGSAFLAGAFAASSLLVGAAIALVHRVSERTLGLIMAFGAGVLISAVAYDLVEEAVITSGGSGVALGIGVGALTFFVGDGLIDRAGGADRKSLRGSAEGSAKAIVLGTVLDGVPESIVVGLSLVSGEGISIAVFVAVFLSNLPEAMAASSGLATSGVARSRILSMWLLVVVVSGLASALGYGLLGDARSTAVAFVQAFAAGAILTMLADTMMPEAYEHGGAVVGLMTSLGFVVAFAIATAERAA